MKKIKYALCFIFGFTFMKLYAQNLVLNPGFEDFKHLIENDDLTKYTNIPYLKLAQVPYWNSATPNGTCDHHNNQHRVKFSQFNNTNAPRTDASCAGFYAYTMYSYNYREYLQGTLSEPLEKGKTYIVSFWLCLAKNSMFATSSIGVYFSTEEKFSYGDSYYDGVIPVTPQVKNPKNQFFTATDGWQKFEQRYTASGGEKSFVIGNFDDQANTLLTKVKDTVMSYQNTKSYYYVDDVCISQKDKPCNTKTEKDKPFHTSVEIFDLQKTLAVIVRSTRRKNNKEREHAAVNLYKKNHVEPIYSNNSIDSFTKSIVTNRYCITAVKPGFEPVCDFFSFPDNISFSKKDTLIKHYLTLYPLDSTRRKCFTFFYGMENSFFNIIKLKVIDDFLKLNPDYIAIVHKKASKNPLSDESMAKLMQSISSLSTYPKAWRYTIEEKITEGQSYNFYIDRICLIQSRTLNTQKFIPVSKIESFEENTKTENNNTKNNYVDCTITFVFIDNNQNKISNKKILVDEVLFQTDIEGNLNFSLKTNTPKEVKIELNGYFPVWKQIDCNTKKYIIMLEKLEKGAKLTLSNIYFEPNSDILKDSSKIALQTIIPFLKNNSNYIIRINGHTDSGVQGTNPAFLMDLSARRAKSVMNYLIGQGIDKNMLMYQGFGSTKPVADNQNAEGRAKNRRTELEIIEMK